MTQKEKSGLQKKIIVALVIWLIIELIDSTVPLPIPDSVREPVRKAWKALRMVITIGLGFWFLYLLAPVLPVAALIGVGVLIAFVIYKLWKGTLVNMFSFLSGSPGFNEAGGFETIAQRNNISVTVPEITNALPNNTSNNSPSGIRPAQSENILFSNNVA